MHTLTVLRRLLLGAACALPVLAAARAPLPPADGSVIVKFKADASAVRVHALAARAETAQVRQALGGRATRLGERVGRTLEAGGAVGERTQVVRARGMSAQALAKLLAADPEVEYAEPNWRVRRHAAPNDPFYLAGPAVTGSSGGPVVGQWYLRAPTAAAAGSFTDLVSPINIEAAWLRSTGSASVVVAVLDTGVRPEHPDLAGRLTTDANGNLYGYDFVTDSEVANDGNGRDADPTDPGDWTTVAENNQNGGTFYGCGSYDRATGRYLAENSSWHGTSTASLVGAAANDGIGMAGAAPGVKVLPVRVLGKCFGDSADILAALRWAAGIHVDGVPDNLHPAKVINMSLGGGSCSAAYQSAVNEVLAAGAVIVASAGNSGGEPMEAPAACSGVIGVTALRNVGTKVGFSSLGTSATQPAIAAPGGNCVNDTEANPALPCLYPILAATNTGTQGPVASGYSDSFAKATLGTSFSSPLVAAVAALVRSVNSIATPEQVRNFLTSTARSFPASGGTIGISACRAAVDGALQYECYCNSYCGAGMLDAGAAVAAAAGNTPVLPTAVIAVTPAAPVVGASITLDGAGSTAGSSALSSYAWTLVSGGSALGGLASGSALGSTRSIAVTATATGTVVVSLRVTDTAGNSHTAQSSFTVAAATPPSAAITVSPSSVTAGGSISYSGSGSTGGSFSVASYQWTLVDGGGAAGSLANGASLGTASSATLTTAAAGTVVVRLTVTDTAGNSASTQASVTVAAAGSGGGSSGGGGGGGGGASSPLWLAGLALAVWRLFRTPRAAPAARRRA